MSKFSYNVANVTCKCTEQGEEREQEGKEERGKKEDKRLRMCTFKSPSKVILCGQRGPIVGTLSSGSIPMMGSKKAWFFLVMDGVLLDTVGHKGSSTHINSISLFNSSQYFNASISHDLQEKIQNVKEHHEGQDSEMLKISQEPWHTSPLLAARQLINK